MAQYGIGARARLQVRQMGPYGPTPAGRLTRYAQVNGTLANGVTLVLRCHLLRDTIGDFKAKISERLAGQIRPDQERLIFAYHHNQEDDRTLSYYNINNGSTLHLAARRSDTCGWARRAVEEEVEEDEEEGEEAGEEEKAEM